MKNRVTEVSSIGLRGMEEYRIQVEVHVMEGQPSFTIIGLPDEQRKMGPFLILRLL